MKWRIVRGGSIFSTEQLAARYTQNSSDVPDGQNFPLVIGY
jgi:hypothetical protein